MLTTHNRILETQIPQQATSSPATLGKLSSKPEPGPQEQCNYVTLKGGLEDYKGMDLEEGREVSIVERKEKNDKGEPITFREKGSFRFLKSLSLYLLIATVYFLFNFALSSFPHHLFIKWAEAVD